MNAHAIQLWEAHTMVSRARTKTRSQTGDARQLMLVGLGGYGSGGPV